MARSWAEPSGARRGTAGGLGAASVVACAYLGYAWLVVAWPLAGPATCPWRTLTGARCPLCGSTKAIGQALAGSWGAVLHQPLALVWFVAVLSIAVAGASAAAMAIARKW